MFENLTRQAESVATGLSVSRRGFLGRAGRGALATAGALGALLAAPRKARAATRGYCNEVCNDACGHHTLCYDYCMYECMIF
jgi:hypothetical protein